MIRNFIIICCCSIIVQCQEAAVNSSATVGQCQVTAKNSSDTVTQSPGSAVNSSATVGQCQVTAKNSSDTVTQSPGSAVNSSDTDFSMISVRAIILGAPGSGKGTISEKIRQNFVINYISSGDILRNNIANKTELGKKIEPYVSSGGLVPDYVMNDVIKSELNKTAVPWLLDGYPRTLPQAEKLSQDVDVNLVINLVVPFEVIVDRLKSRWIHAPSGRVYNIGFNDPKIPGLDDFTNETLVQREDDKPEVVQKRLDTYASTINPVIEFYTKKNVLHTFKGNTSREIWSELSQFLLKKIKLIDPN